jgi:hypothetical protein
MKRPQSLRGVPRERGLISRRSPVSGADTRLSVVVDTAEPPIVT